MTPKQRVQAIFNRQPVDMIPVDMWYTSEVLTEAKYEREKRMSISKVVVFGVLMLSSFGIAAEQWKVF